MDAVSCGVLRPGPRRFAGQVGIADDDGPFGPHATDGGEVPAARCKPVGQRPEQSATERADDRSVERDRASRLAALVSYYAFFPRCPLLLMLVMVLGFVLSGHDELALLSVPWVGEAGSAVAPPSGVGPAQERSRPALWAVRPSRSLV